MEWHCPHNQVACDEAYVDDDEAYVDDEVEDNRRAPELAKHPAVEINNYRSTRNNNLADDELN